tara:strand:- start:1380 stop:2216 length:837 start_codon:yes stop_codon:yes gene_type:complete
MKHPNEEQDETAALDHQSESGEPSIEPSTEEPSGEISDLTIGFGEIHFRQIACPACVGESSEFDISAELKLHHPTSGNYIEYLTPTGTCTTSLYNTHVSSQPLPSTQPAYFNDISLTPSGLGIWANINLYEYQYLRNTSYSVSTENGVIEDAFTTIEGFDSIEPYTLLWVDPSYAFDTVISKSNTTFTWSPVVPNSQFEILIAVYSPDGTQLLGSVSCMEEDSGYMNIPGSYFQSYPSWSLAAVHLTRHKTDRREAPQLNGWFQSHMIWEVVGTAHVE